MKHILFVGFCLAGLLASRVDSSAGKEAYKTFQLALFNPVQLVDEEDSVGLLRLNLIYGKNENVEGIDIGLFNRSTGKMEGLALGLYNWVEGYSDSLQVGIINRIDDEMIHYQVGIWNRTKVSQSGQIGIVNHTDQIVEGFQVGLINYTQTFSGRCIQIGLINIATDGPLPFLPIVNGQW